LDAIFAKFVKEAAAGKKESGSECEFVWAK
jgi:hypothetical protein